MKSSTCSILTTSLCLFLSPFPLLGNSPVWSQTYNPTASDPATNNTAGGTSALTNNSGFNNTAFGFEALGNNTLGQQNTAVGSFALQAATGSVSQNSAFGSAVMANTTTGQRNSAVGASSLIANTSGGRNAAIGMESLLSNTTGSDNTALGYQTMKGNITGNLNTALGHTALLANRGSRNTAIGWGAGSNLQTGVDNIYLGNLGTVNENKTMRLGSQGMQTKTFIYGVKETIINGATVTISPAGQLGTLPSSARYKEDIADMRGQSTHIMKLRPVTYHYKNDDTKTKQYGLIAEEVAKVYPELVVYGENGIESVQYQGLIPMLLNEVQEQKKAIAALQERITALEQKK